MSLIASIPEDEPPEGASVSTRRKPRSSVSQKQCSSDDEQEEGATCFVSHDDNDSNDNCDGEEETWKQPHNSRVNCEQNTQVTACQTQPEIIAKHLTDHLGGWKCGIGSNVKTVLN